MATDNDSDIWSDTSSENEAATPSASFIQSRAYQIEMFEQSMQGNIIAVVTTQNRNHVELG